MTLDAGFAALADPTRRAIVTRLTRGEATVSELAADFPVTLQAVSQHVRVLQRAGLLAQGRSRQSRPCRLDPAALGVLSDWIETTRRTWEQRLDRLDAHLREIGS